MPLLLLLAAAGLTIFRSDIKSLDSYSFFIQNPAIAYQLKVEDENGDTLNELRYIPHVSSFTGLSISYQQVEFSISFQNEDEDKKYAKESRLLDLQLMGTFNKHLWQLYYQNYQGLYITDSSVTNSNQPKANSYSWGGSMTHFFRNGYIVDRSLGNFMLEKESNWSPLARIYFNKTKLSSEKGLIPTQFEPNFNQLKGLTAFETNNLGLGLGLTGMYTKYGFFLNGLLSAGIQYQEQNFSGIDQSKRVVTSNNVNFIIDAGYAYKNHSLGIQQRAQVLVTPVKNASYNQTNALSMVYYKYFF